MTSDDGTERAGGKYLVLYRFKIETLPESVEHAVDFGLEIYERTNLSSTLAPVHQCILS